MNMLLVKWLAFSLMILFVQVTQATEREYSHRAFGGVGLLQMPSARMSDVGSIAVFLNRSEPYSRGGIAAQPFTWFEVLFRHASVSNRDYGVSGGQSYKDKGIDFKLRLYEESYYWPQVALGFQDFAGTGLFSGEYFVLSKHWGNADFSLGYGWGYVGASARQQNPLAQIDDGFEKRDSDVGSGGNIAIGNYFSGKGGSIFAGVEYQLPRWPLSFKLEYEGNNYQNEALDNRFDVSSPWNIGLVYQPWKFVDIHVAYERGNTLALGLTFKHNIGFGKPMSKNFEAPPLAISTPAVTAKWDVVASALQEHAGMEVSEIQLLQPDTLRIKASSKGYQNRSKAVGRGGRVLLNTVDDSVQQFQIVEQTVGMNLNEVQIARSDLTDVLTANIDEKTFAQKAVMSGDKEQDIKASTIVYKRDKPFSYYFSPGLIQSIGGPDAFILYQLTANAQAKYQFSSSTWLSGKVEVGLLDNFERFDYTAPSNLPRVRTNIREYLTSSKLRLNNLQLNQTYQVAPDWFGMTYAGYLEMMYAGAGGELLYRPYAKKWAVGIDVNYVRQRHFNVDFRLREYDVFTGHLSFYTQLPWLQDSFVKLSMGRYLAKDMGATIDISRKFDNGASMGFWLTKTNVSSEQFGEGSFDKGLYLEIPLNLFSIKNSRDTLRFSWAFLTRDGGQMLKRKYDLYTLTGDHEISDEYQRFEQIKD